MRQEIVLWRDYDPEGLITLQTRSSSWISFFLHNADVEATRGLKKDHE